MWASLSEHIPFKDPERQPPSGTFFVREIERTFHFQEKEYHSLPPLSICPFSRRSPFFGQVYGAKKRPDLLFEIGAFLFFYLDK